MSASKPNVIFLHVDQLKAMAVGAYGADRALVRTPAMDEIARRGTLFERSYATNPVCVPARTCWYTGLPSEETGVIQNNDAPLDHPTLGPLVAAAGYDSLYIGKWHIPAPIAREFTVLPGGESRGEFGDPTVARSVEHFFARRRGDKPFFLNIGLLNPHDICYYGWKPDNPLQSKAFRFLENGDPAMPPLPPNYNRPWRESDKWTPEQWRMYTYTYYRLTEMVDAEIGRILDAFLRSPYAENTLFIFSSDHGQGNGEHRHQTKSTPFEHSVRVPLTMFGPGIPTGCRVGDLVCGMDVHTTVCAASGAAPNPRARGIDLAAWARDSAARDPSRVILGCTQNYLCRFLVTPGHKYVREQGREQPMLFDLRADPWERDNLAPSNPALASELEQRMVSIEQTYTWHPRTLAYAQGGRSPKGKKQQRSTDE